tara:strand:- start:275 stop:403 length:129 start_codon:yes stop_codon:yes gene_type:complete
MESFECLDWYEANEESTFNTKDLTIEELKWIQSLAVFNNEDN